MRNILLVCLLMISYPGWTFQTSYFFSGQASTIPDIFDSSIEAFSGSLSFDPSLHPMGPRQIATGFTATTAGDVWDRSIDELFGPFTGLSFTDHSVTYYDEGVQGTTYVGRVNLTFNFLADTFTPGTLMEHWPLERFTGGTFLLADFGRYDIGPIQGTIDHLYNAASVPEPSFWVLLAIGLLGAFTFRLKN